VVKKPATRTEKFGRLEADRRLVARARVARFFEPQLPIRIHHAFVVNV